MCVCVYDRSIVSEFKILKSKQHLLIVIHRLIDALACSKLEAMYETQAHGDGLEASMHRVKAVEREAAQACLIADCSVVSDGDCVGVAIGEAGAASQ